MSKSWKIYEAARATSAAPGYFDLFKKQGIVSEFVDGGISTTNPQSLIRNIGLVANNPTELALYEAQLLFGPMV